MIYLIGALAALALIVFFVGKRFFASTGGVLGAAALLLSPAGVKLLALPRADAAFALLVTLGALLAWRALIKGKSWVPFWLVGAAATLAGGPLGALLAGGGALLLPWERAAGWKRRAKGGHLAGAAAFLLLTAGGCFVLGRCTGRAPLAIILSPELRGVPLLHFYQPIFYAVAGFLPWSLFTLLGIVRVLRHPAVDDGARRFERFLVATVLCGLALLAVVPQPRPADLYPLLPFAAILAGRELAALAIFKARKNIFSWLADGITGMRLAAFERYQALRLGKARVARRAGMREFAHLIRSKVGSAFPLTHFRSPRALQFYLGAMRPEGDAAAVAEVLKCSCAAFVVVDRLEALHEILGEAGAALHVVAQWPEPANPEMLIVSNHPRLEYTPRMAVALGPLAVKLDGVHLVSARGGALDATLDFWAKQPSVALALTHHGDRPVVARVRIRNVFPEVMEYRMLAPGESWQIAAGKAPEAARPVRAGLISDCRQAYEQMDRLGRDRAFQALDFVIINGDFAFEAEWRFDLFLRQARRWGVPIFPTVGNHDILPHSPYPFEAFMNRFGYLNHAFESGAERIVFLETGTKRIHEAHLDYLGEACAGAAAPGVLFMHVPPDTLKSGNELRVIESAGAAGVRRIFCGHINEYSHRDYETAHGRVTVTVSGCGGEKSYEKKYDQHWLELVLAAGGVEEIKHEIALPHPLVAAKAHLIHRDLFLLRRLAPAALLYGLLTLAVAGVGYWAIKRYL